MGRVALERHLVAARRSGKCRKQGGEIGRAAESARGGSWPWWQQPGASISEPPFGRAPSSERREEVCLDSPCRHRESLLANPNERSWLLRRPRSLHPFQRSTCGFVPFEDGPASHLSRGASRQGTFKGTTVIG